MTFSPIRSVRPLLISCAVVGLIAHSAAFAREVQLRFNEGSPLRLKANDASASPTQNGQSIAYFSSNQSQDNRRTLQVRLDDPVLCADFSTGVSDDRVRLRLVQTNGDIQGGNVRGFAGISNYQATSDTGGIRYAIDPSNADLAYLRVATDNLVCYGFSLDTIFANGFESALRVPSTSTGLSADATSRVPLIDVDLETTIRAQGGAALTTARPGSPLTYVITVTNNGSVTANNVQVRDYFPKRTSAAQGNSAGAAFSSGANAWSCVGSNGASCGTLGTTNDYVFVPNATIPSFGALTITVTRTLLDTPTLLDGSRFSLYAAAFTAPTEQEINVGNNPASAALVTQTNQAPNIAILSNPVRTRGDCPIGGATTCLTTITVSDDSTLPAQINVQAVSAAPSDLQIDEVSTPNSAPSERRIRFQLAPTFSGNVTINVTATDLNGASTPRPVVVVVNDPPPTISNIPDQLRDEDNGLVGPTTPLLVIGPLPFTIGGVGVDVNAVNVTASSDDTLVIPASAIALGGSGANRTITITVPRHNYNMLSTTVGNPTLITVSVANGSSVATESFDIRLIAVNDPPFLTVRGTTNFNTPTPGANQSIANWFVSQSVGPDNEVNVVPGSGVQPQIINFRSIQINNQNGPVIQDTAQTPVVGVDQTTIQVRWVTGSVPTGAACLQGTLEDSGGAVASAVSIVSVNNGTVSPCTPLVRAAAK
jgi:uncharacterized repeat protein (TIGR01451 family)